MLALTAVELLALAAMLRLQLISCVEFYLHQGVFPLLSVYLKHLSSTDVSARTMMKGAAKCDNHCELQNSVNH